MIQEKMVRVFFFILSILVAGCGPNQGHIPTPPANTTPFDAKITLNLAETSPVNRMILGNNVQWVDRGDELLQGNTLNLSADKVQKAKKMGVTVLRYPGGSLSDLYHWKDGMGPISKRKRNKRFDGEGDDQVLLGTVEFLTFAKSVGAEPLITVNMATGTPQEAADWLKAVNITGMKDDKGNPLPRVKYWEIGNEPYLVGHVRKELAMEPEEFARRANATIKAMKAVDPSIVVGLPLRSDKLGVMPATPMQGFNDKVLGAMKEPFEYVALHNAYFPFSYENVTNVNSLYLSVMSSGKFVKQDIEYTLGMLNKYFPGKKFGVAITEYNAFFTMGQGSTDGLISSLIGAIYVADLLTLFAGMDEVMMANFWSLSGNWHFGAIRQDGQLRPAYYVLEGFNRVLNGEKVGCRIDAATFKGAKVGFIPHTDGNSSIAAVFTRNKGKIMAFVLNKNIGREAKLAIEIPGQQKIKSIKIQTLTSDSFQADQVNIPGWSPFKSLPVDQPVAISPHSAAIFEIELG